MPVCSGTSTGREVMSLNDLFNFENTFWVDKRSRTSTLGLQKEMELYDISDLDEHRDVDDDTLVADDV